MIELFTKNYAYWFIVIVMMLGLYSTFFKRNLVKQLIGLNMFQVGTILFYVASAVKPGGDVPVYNPDIPLQAASYMNPLLHTLMLTAIVVSVGTMGVAFALLLTIYRRYKTLDEVELLERMND